MANPAAETRQGPDRESDQDVDALLCEEATLAAFRQQLALRAEGPFLTGAEMDKQLRDRFAGPSNRHDLSD